MAEPILTCTPVKHVKCCIACSKSSRGHIRLLKNIALQSIYKDILSVLNVSLPNDLTNLYICTPCISLISKIRDLRQQCQENVADISNESRRKRIITHSVLPKPKRQFNNERVDVDSGGYTSSKPSEGSCMPDTVIKCTGQNIKRKGKKLVFMHESKTYNIEKEKESPSTVEHSYASADNKLSVNQLFERHRLLSKMTTSSVCIEKIKSILEKYESLDDNTLFGKLLSSPEINDRIWTAFLLEMNSEMDMLCSTKSPSVLRKNVTEVFSASLFGSIYNEMNERAPKVFDTLVCLSSPIHMTPTSSNHTVAAMYSLAQNSRNNHMSVLQKQVASACIRYGAGNGLFNILSSLGISIGQNSKIPLLSQLSEVNGKGVLEELKTGKTIKITVDNIDGRIRANQVRIGSGNRDFHYTHWSVIIDRVNTIDVPCLSHQEKPQPVEGPNPDIFFLSSEEHDVLRSSYTWLIEKILTEEIPCLNIFKLPDVLDHPYRAITDRPSSVYPMFVIMKDPKYLPNCVQIMDTIKNSLQSLYIEAGRGEEFENTASVPLGGDQLTRVTFDSARNLRAGAHTRTERLEQFTPVIGELFHIEQDLLEKIVKRFFMGASYREEGTLANYKAILHRTNVNGQVKSSNGFEPHKDFVHMVARAMITELACEVLGMEDIAATIQLPEQIQFWSQKKRKEWLDKFVKPIVDILFIPYTCSVQDIQDINMMIFHKGTAYRIAAPPQYRGKSFEIDIDGTKVQIAVPPAPEKNDDRQGSDDMSNYSLAFVRAAIDLIVFHYVIKAGDVDRLTIMLKRFIPLFVGLTSYRSKYAIECINFITKTECILSEYESLRVKLGAFVNMKGKAGKNKSADMQQENNIKMVKNVIRNLGAGKTDKAMERSSKAAPVISGLVSCMERSLGMTKTDKHHVKKSSVEDFSVLTTKMRTLRPFHINPNRRLQTFEGVTDSVMRNLDKVKLKEFIIRHSKRAVAHVIEEDEDEDEN